MKANGVIIVTMFIGIIIVYTLIAILGGYCWDYTISKWLVHFGKPDTFKLWMGICLGFVPTIGQLGMPLAVVTWIATFFM